MHKSHNLIKSLSVEDEEVIAFAIEELARKGSFDPKRLLLYSTDWSDIRQFFIILRQSFFEYRKTTHSHKGQIIANIKTIEEKKRIKEGYTLFVGNENQKIGFLMDDKISEISEFYPELRRPLFSRDIHTTHNPDIVYYLVDTGEVHAHDLMIMPDISRHNVIDGSHRSFLKLEPEKKRTFIHNYVLHKAMPRIEKIVNNIDKNISNIETKLSRMNKKLEALA